MPRGKLDIPSELLAHSHGRGGERRSSREGRESRSEGREGRESFRRTPRQPVDDFFYKPYVPSSSAATSEPEAPRTTSAPKRQLAVLLGGSRKPL